MIGGDNMEKEYKIKGGEILLTENHTATYEVCEGEALVYIVPIEKDNSIGRRLFVYEATQGEHVPALDYIDADKNKWQFAIVAIDEVTIKLKEIDD